MLEILSWDAKLIPCTRIEPLIMPANTRPVKVLFFYPIEFAASELNVFGQIIRNLDPTRTAAYLVVNSVATQGISDGQIARQWHFGDNVRVRSWFFGNGMRGGRSSVKLRSAFATVSGVVKAAMYARREKVDIVQCTQTPLASLMGLLLARLAGAQLLVHYHDKIGRFGNPQLPVERMVARRANGLVTVSEFLRNEVLPVSGASPQKVHVILNGVFMERFTGTLDGTRMRNEYGIGLDAPLVLQLARLYPTKRQEDFVEAFALAREAVPTLRGLILGWEDPRLRFPPFESFSAKLKSLCEERGLGDSLIVAPARPEAAELIAAADILALPSVDEPFGLVIAEAMAVGRPVVGARSGGIPEIIVDNETGFLVEPRAPRDLADKLIMLATNPDLRTRMGLAGRRRVEKSFTEDRIARAFSEIYESMISGRPSPIGQPDVGV